jgi:MobA-like NTP transferase domain
LSLSLVQADTYKLVMMSLPNAPPRVGPARSCRSDSGKRFRSSGKFSNILLTHEGGFPEGEISDPFGVGDSRHARSGQVARRLPGGGASGARSPVKGRTTGRGTRNSLKLLRLTVCCRNGIRISTSHRQGFVMKAVILAGGLGTRISEETQVRPKPMIEIGGKPILWHILKIYSHFGINDFIICCGYKG